MRRALTLLLAFAALACAGWGLAAVALTPVPLAWRIGALAVALAIAGVGLRTGRPLAWYLVALAGLLLGISVRALAAPSLDLDWIAEQARAPEADFAAGGGIQIRNVRNFRFAPGGAVVREAWETRSYDLERVRSVWFGVSPFGGIPGAGHVFVSFGFDDGRYLAISVEGRKEKGESYHPVSGLYRNYELVYVVGDERDVIALRTQGWDDEVYLYPVRATPAAMRAALRGMLERADRLAHAPEFYDTVFNSCSVNVARHVNQVVEGLVPRSPKLLFAAFSDELALELGLIDFEGTVEQARARFAIKARSQGDVDSGDFSARIRQGADLSSSTGSRS